jgi:hypothetical protein
MTASFRVEVSQVGMWVGYIKVANGNEKTGEALKREPSKEGPEKGNFQEKP